jgi:hypothetical protein
MMPSDGVYGRWARYRVWVNINSTRWQIQSQCEGLVAAATSSCHKRSLGCGHIRCRDLVNSYDCSRINSNNSACCCNCGADSQEFGAGRAIRSQRIVNPIAAISIVSVANSVLLLWIVAPLAGDGVHSIT